MVNKAVLSFLVVVLAVFFLGCNNNDDGCSTEPNLNVNQERLDADIEAIDEYLSENNINAQTHSSGLRYVITEEGDGKSPTLCDNITVTYEGSLLSNGNVFDGTESPVNFPLDRLITGWQIGIPLIETGGSITLYIPSGFGYGSSGSDQAIPPNANLKFTITLVDVD